MKIISSLLGSLFLFFPVFLHSQNRFLNNHSDSQEETVTREVVDNGLDGMKITYNFSGVGVTNVSVADSTYQMLHVKNFSYLKEVGKPAIPSHNDLVAVPEGANVSVFITKIKYKDY